MENVMVSWGTYQYHADANKVYMEILDIGNSATPQQIVDKAKDESTELHSCFTWNNDEAAEKYRLFEARQVVRNLVFTPVKSDNSLGIKRRLLFKTDNSHDSGYKSVFKIVRNEDEYQGLLQMAWQELKNFKRKYKNITELQEIIELIP